MNYKQVQRLIAAWKRFGLWEEIKASQVSHIFSKGDE